MREEFYSIYREMDAEYSQYSRQRQRAGFGWPQWGASLAVVDEAVTEALEESPVSVRPDAVYFLRVNLHQMVAEPLFRREHSGAYRRDLDPGELKEDIKHDASIVIREAARAGEAEITGHQIVNALSRSWELLRITSFEIWG